MFGNILGKSEQESGKENAHKEIMQKVSKMNLTDMRAYVNNKVKDFEITEDGLIVVLRRLILEDEHTSKRYIQSDDMDSKIKKAFDLVITIGSNKKISIAAIELIQQFTEVYAEIIANYDKEHKDIYSSRFKDTINKGIKLVGQMTALERKMGVLRK